MKSRRRAASLPFVGTRPHPDQLLVIGGRESLQAGFGKQARSAQPARRPAFQRANAFAQLVHLQHSSKLTIRQALVVVLSEKTGHL
jgi:hypothetical protein